MLTETSFLYTQSIVHNSLQHWDELEAFASTVTARRAVRKRAVTNPYDLYSVYIDIKDALQRLSDKQHNAIQQHLMEGHPLVETAAALGIHEKAVRKRIGRGISQLVDILNFGRIEGPISEVKVSCP